MLLVKTYLNSVLACRLKLEDFDCMAQGLSLDEILG